MTALGWMPLLTMSSRIWPKAFVVPHEDDQGQFVFGGGAQFIDGVLDAVIADHDGDRLFADAELGADAGGQAKAQVPKPTG